MTLTRPARIRPIAAVGLLTLLSGLATAQQTSTTPGQPGVDISGMWLVQDPGSGSWTEFFENSTGPAPVLEEIEKYRQESAARQNPLWSSIPVGYHTPIMKRWNLILLLLAAGRGQHALRETSFAIQGVH